MSATTIPARSRWAMIVGNSASPGAMRSGWTTSSPISCRPAMISGTAANRSSARQTDLTDTAVFSPGGMTDGNTNKLYALQTCGAINCAGAPHANYVYDHVVLTRVTGLPQGQPTANALGWFGGVTSITRLVAQISNGNLIPSEQIGIGGVDTVRGYDNRIANGSEGVFMSEELRTPAFSLANLLLHTTSPWNDLTQLGIFYDYGSVFDNNTAPGAPNSIELE